MSTTEIDTPLFEHLQELAASTEFANTLKHLTEQQQLTLFLFFSALACKSEDEYLALKAGADSYNQMSDEFRERMALVSRAFCIGHDWVTNNWSLWKK